MFVPVIVDAGGSVIEPALHDSKIASIHFDKGDIGIVVTNTNSERVNIRFTGVRRAACINLAEQNVVLDFWCEKEPREVLAALNRVEPGGSSQQIAYRRSLEELVMEGRLKIWRISPSYGGELTILSSNAEFYSN